MAQKSDAPANLGELRRWNKKADLDDNYLINVNRRWRMLGRLVRQPASLRGAENHN